MQQQQIVFIDANVPDLQDLLSGLAPGVKAFVLDPSQDGLQQIANILAENDLTDLSSISIVGHGAPGAIELGSSVLDAGDLESDSAALSQIGAALAPDGALQLYSCDVASGAVGQQFIADLSQYAGGVAVDASDQAIGQTASGENWNLDVSTSPSAAPASAPFTDQAMASFQGDLSVTPIDDDQDSLVLSELVVESGQFPTFTNEPTADPGGIYLGSIRIFAGLNTGSYDQLGDAQVAQGENLTNSSDMALFSILGDSYGTTNDQQNFDLPNLDGALMVGAGSGPSGTVSLGESYGQDFVTLSLANLPTATGGGGQSFSNDQPSLAIHYLINVGGGGLGLDVPGMIVPYLGSVAPNGYLFADDQVLSDTQYANLYAAIGDTYDAGTSAVPGLTFALPNLQGRNIVGAGGTLSLGTEQGADQTTLSTNNLPSSGDTSIDNEQPSLALTYMIYIGVNGDGTILPSSGTLGGDTPYLGEIVAFAGSTIPSGWTVAEGQTLQISSNQTLFSVLGTTYGGNGVTTFDLPDLVGESVVGTSSADTIGTAFGSDSYRLSSSQLPADLPMLGNVNETSANYEQGTSPVVLAFILTLADPLGYDITSATVLIQDADLLSGDTLAATTTDTNITASYSDGTLTLTGTDTVADYQQVLDTVTYSSTASDPTNDFKDNSRSIKWSVTDANGQTGSATSTIDIYNLTLSGLPEPADYFSGNVLLAPRLTIDDLSTQKITSATIRITGGTFTNDGDTLAATTAGTNISASYSAGSETLTLTGTDTLANYQAVLSSVAFASTSADPSDNGVDPTRTVTWTVTDSSDVSSVAQTTTIVFPEFDTAATSTFAYSGPAVTLSPSVVLVDADTIVSATIQIAGGTFAGDGDTLPASEFGVAGKYSAASETLTLIVGETASDFQTLLESVTFQSTSTDPTDNGADPTRTIDWSVTDAGGNTFSASETVDLVPCYCPGTLIATRRGSKPVEKLQIGDKVMTVAGVARPIKWIGRRSYGGRFILGRADILPVCIKAGALDDNVPRRDLWISPHHAMFLEGVLIEAKDLVNGVSIVQAKHVDSVEYFHVELDSHDVLIAEGAPSETFIDDDSRGMFHNADEYRVLYPDARPAIAVQYCAPRLENGYEVEQARRRIALRAGLRAQDEASRLGALRGYIDLISPRCIAGWAQNVDHPEGPVCLDIYIGGQLIGQVLANRYREDLEQAGLGSGHHSFAFTSPDGLAFTPREVEVRRSLDGNAVKASAGAQTAMAVRPPSRAQTKVWRKRVA